MQFMHNVSSIFKPGNNKKKANTFLSAGSGIICASFAPAGAKIKLLVASD